MAFLDADVEICFSTGPNDPPVWESVGSDLVSFSTRRGKQGSLWASGTAKVTLNNLLRQYWPLFDGSPYYPNVIPRKQIRIVAGGVTRFAGKIERWETVYPSKNKALAIITAADIFKDLANML